MGIRQADKAGSWYPGNARELRRELAACMKRGDLLLAGKEMPTGSPAAAAVPHAGLVFSGGVAATAFRAIGNAFEQVDCFVVFGACHRERLGKPAIWARGKWETPLGSLAVDEKTATLLLDLGLGEENERAHLGDNAIELLTPFIKSLYPDAAILPIAMDFFPDSAEFGGKAAEAVLAAAGGKTVVALASTDLTHYGMSFGVMPAGVGEAAIRWTRENDRRFLDCLTGLRLDDIVPTARRDHSACGAGAAAAAAGWARRRGCEKGVVLAYETSHDVLPRGPAESFVGYASVLYTVSRSPKTPGKTAVPLFSAPGKRRTQVHIDISPLPSFNTVLRFFARIARRPTSRVFRSARATFDSPC